MLPPHPAVQRHLKSVELSIEQKPPFRQGEFEHGVVLLFDAS
jgi:hypothetical protein